MMTACNHTIKTDRGFTLLEILVAMAVMAVVLVTLLQLQSGTIRLAGAGKFTGTVPLLAARQLAVLSGDPSVFSCPPDSSGLEYGGLEWTCSVEDAVFEGPVTLSDQQADRLKKIRFTITAPGSGRSYSLTTWRYRVESDD